jgi:hypothetical protein
MESETISEAYGIKLIRTRKICISKTKNKEYFKYRYLVLVDENLVRDANTHAQALHKYIILINEEKARLQEKALVIKTSSEHLNVSDNTFIKELIDFRIDNIHTVTIEHYKVLKNIIALCELCTIEEQYINNIKTRFKHFRL